MEKNYRIHTNIINDTVLNVNMSQDYDFLEVLSLKLRQKDAYRLHSSNYGVIIGRVLANDAFGIPNVKVSVFIPKSDDDPTYMESVYPYSELTDYDKEGRRYNLLPNDSTDDCYRIVGTFPSKRLVLDDDTTLEIYDKYWKFTTVTNNAGDYMIFGVPSGNQQVHVDMDLSDIGILSQTPTDFEHKGYNITMFDNAKQFKESTNLDGLVQIFSQNKSVFVYPFWGDDDNGIAAITRCDVQIQYKFEPTCVFMGSIISDNEGNSIGAKCAPDEDNGMNDQLVAGEGTIEMIRKTPDGLVEEYSIQGNQLIDSNGVWCYQIPMNLDFIATDEYGNIVPTDNPNKGIPTRTQVRFRFSKTETGNEGGSTHTAKYLVPMNPLLVTTKPKSQEDGKYIERMYTFGSSTPDSCFRDLYWNNVYSVKNYIPKTQVAHRAYSPNYTGLKGSNLATDQNPIPFNKLRIDLPFVYIVLCILFNIVAIIVSGINHMINILNGIIKILNVLHDLKIPIINVRPFGWIPEISYIGCISLGGGLSSDNTAFYPGCDDRGMDAADCPEDMENCKKRASVSVLMDIVQQRLAEDYKIVKLDFYQDWLNGSLYMPLWYWRKRKKKTFLFFTISSAKNEFCSCDKTYSRLKSFVTCNFRYSDKRLGVSDSVFPESENKWHRNAKRAGRIFFPHGLIKPVENRDGLTAYYYAAIQATSDSDDVPMEELRSRFNAFRLFATDIILLGNLNESNMYGIPQFFKNLPSTTANIPPIATIREASDTSVGYNRSSNELADEGETGPALTTGMDWEDSGEDSPIYKEGLFMDLECTYARTKAKSCINAERLCELGMNLDMVFDSQYPTSSGLKTGTFESDGLITKIELDDTENRAMFATMNQIGFVPQSYQDSIGGKTTQVPDEMTNYLIPKFKYMYPVDLDGRLRPITERYKNGFKQALDDIPDDTYINFRLGDVEFISNGNGQFYDGNSMPLYNNSFYFYFGVNKGNTAIDKFNKMFNAQCFKNKKTAFSLDISTRGRSYCQEAYKISGDGDSYILVESDDIQKPYSYRLYSVVGELKASGSGLTANSFTITDIPNQSYNLIVTDDNGKSVTEHIVVSMEAIALPGSSKNLGTEFVDSATTPKSYICQKDANLNGEIRFSSLYIDGYNVKITGVSLNSASAADAKIYVYGENEKFKDEVVSGEPIPKATVVIENLDGSYLKPCLCDTIPLGYDYRMAFFSAETESGNIEFGFKVYKPTTFMVKVYQDCNGIFTANTTSYTLAVNNGKQFQASINGVSTMFMDNFTSASNEINTHIISADSGTTINKYLSGWCEVNDEKEYSFPPFTEDGLKKWNTVIKLNSLDTDDLGNKRAIIKHKFSCIFNLSSAVYINSDNGTRFKYTAGGGVEPILYRSVAPYYSNNELETLSKSFIYGDNAVITTNPDYPLIVGLNYKDNSGNDAESPRLNELFTENPNINRYRWQLGNYFAAFTNNGGYINEYEGDCEKLTQAIPHNAYVNLDYAWKKLGKNLVIDKIPELAYSASSVGEYATSCSAKTTNPYLRTMTVDRRIDYDLFIAGPIVTIPTAYTFTEKEKTQIKSTRVAGYIQNGIEMSYDEEYNIIDVDIRGRIFVNQGGNGYYCWIAKNTPSDTNKVYGQYGFTRDQVVDVNDYSTYISEIEEDKVIHIELLDYTYYNGYFVKAVLKDDGNIYRDKHGKFHWIDGNGNDYSADTYYSIIENENGEKAVPSYRLEYSYQYGGDSTGVTTILSNPGDYTNYTFVNHGDMVSRTITDVLGVDDSKARFKQFYSFTIGDIDCRQILWYLYTTDGLRRYANSPNNQNWSLPFYIKKYEDEELGEMGVKYSGYYSFDVNGNPPKRLLDVNLLSGRRDIDIEITPCSYDLGVDLNDDGVFTATVNEGESMDMNPSFHEAITPLTYSEILDILYKQTSAYTNIFDWGDVTYKYNYYNPQGRSSRDGYDENDGFYILDLFNCKVDMVVGFNKESSDSGDLYYYKPKLISPSGIYLIKARDGYLGAKGKYKIYGNGYTKMKLLNKSDGSICTNIKYNHPDYINDPNDDGRMIWVYEDGEEEFLTTEHPELYTIVSSSVDFRRIIGIGYQDEGGNWKNDGFLHIPSDFYKDDFMGGGIKGFRIWSGNGYDDTDVLTNDDCSCFSLMTKKLYDNSLSSHLTRKIEAIDFSDFYGIGKVKIKCTVNNRVECGAGGSASGSVSGSTTYDVSFKSIRFTGIKNLTSVQSIDVIGVMCTGDTNYNGIPSKLYVKKATINNIHRSTTGDTQEISFTFKHEDVFWLDEYIEFSQSDTSYFLQSIIYFSVLLKYMNNGREYIYRFRVFPEHVDIPDIGDLEDRLIGYFDSFDPR